MLLAHMEVISVHQLWAPFVYHFSYHPTSLALLAVVVPFSRGTSRLWFFPLNTSGNSLIFRGGKSGVVVYGFIGIPYIPSIPTGG